MQSRPAPVSTFCFCTFTRHSGLFIQQAARGGQAEILQLLCKPPNLSESVKSDIQFDPKLLGKSLSEMRHFLSLSLRELSRASGVSHSQILRIESGEFDCFTSSFVRLCGAMGIRFGDLIERCVKPDYDLYSNAIEAELNNINIPEIEAKLALKDLVFGASVALACILRASWPTAVALELDYPNDAIRSKFLKFASHLERQPWDGGKRYIIFKELQQKPMLTLTRFLGFPSKEDVKEHVASTKTKSSCPMPGWFPFRRPPSLVNAGYVFTTERPKEETGLTDSETSSKSVAVKAQLPELLERLKKATAQPGQKTALANFLSKQSGPKIPLASVSRWLSGEREPGGEVTLKMIRWCELQERQPK